jgi:ABC-type bacteriocin/lantibiotic exporter with double-glycine peptidase domain
MGGSKVGAVFLVAALLPLGACAAIPQAGNAASDSAKEKNYPQVDDPLIQRHRTICGPNALYMFLRSHGSKATYSSIVHILPMQSNGCTLLAMRDTARRLGISANVLKFSPEDVTCLHLPAVVHFHRSVFLGDNVDHYVVLTGVFKNRVEYIDGTTAQRHSVSLAKLAAASDGYALEHPRDWDVSWSAFTIPIGALLATIAVASGRPRGRRCAGNMMAPAVAALAAALCLANSSIAKERIGESPAASAGDLWRGSTFDATTALDLYMRVVGHHVPRAEIADALRAVPQITMASVAQASTVLGVPAEASRPTLADLANGPSPLILHMWDDAEQHGGYYLLLTLDDRHALIVNAATAVVETYGVDEFRHRWSGYALWPRETPSSGRRWTAASMIIAAIYVVFRNWRSTTTLHEVPQLTPQSS